MKNIKLVNFLLIASCMLGTVIIQNPTITNAESVTNLQDISPRFSLEPDTGMWFTNSVGAVNHYITAGSRLNVSFFLSDWSKKVHYVYTVRDENNNIIDRFEDTSNSLQTSMTIKKTGRYKIELRNVSADTAYFSSYSVTY